MIKHARLDMKPASPTPDRSGLADGVFVEKTSERVVRVELPPQSNNVINVTAEPGVYGVGAGVVVRLGRDGKPVGVIPPQSLPDGVEPLGVGVTGETTLEAKTTADKAAGDALDALEDARKAWQEAVAARESIETVDSSASAAQAAADAAQAAAALNQLAIEAAQEAQELENARLEGLAVDADAKAETARARANELAEQAQAAMTVAQQAQTSADGKALVAYSDYQPATVSGQKIIWFKPGSVPMLFDGEEWRSVQPGDGVVEALDIGTATVGELSGMRIKAGTASVDILIPGENARWTSSGLTIYHPLTPEQQQAGIEPTEWDNRSVALNLTSDGARFISVADEAGTVTAYMSPQGEVSGRELTITGAAAVDTLEVGGLDLEDWLGTRQLVPVGMTVLPGLEHPEGTQTVHMGWTDITLPPGRYVVEWMPSLRRRSGNDDDAYGAYLEWNYATGAMQPFEGGSTRIAGWYKGGIYGNSTLRGVFTVEDNDTGSRDIKIFYGIHSYYKNRIVVEYPSVVLLSRVPDQLEMSHNLVTFSTTPTPPPPPAKTYTTTARLSDIYFAYGNTFAQSGSYQSGGIFRLPAVKGRQVVSINVTGKCNFDFADGGQGRSFPFYLGGENKSYFLHDFGTVKLVGGARAGGNLSANGLINFAVSRGAPVYTTYDPSSFRCTVTYQ
ncbi:MAG: hypothetical protein QM234_08910 [Acidobacteriota bacterium]|nr:hypothetical protein [Acidobacteriota bacterium]